MNSPIIDTIAIENHKSRNPSIVEKINFRVNGYASRAGNRILFEPAVLKMDISNPPLNVTRTNNIYLASTSLETERVTVTIPNGYEVSSIPPNVLEDNDFGFFEANYSLEDNILTFTSSFYTKRGTHPPTRYREFVEFYRKIHQANKAQVVLVAK